MRACVVLTTMGRVLLQCERDATLPLHFARLALLLASLLQFATPSERVVRVALRHGLSVVVSVDAAASVASAVVYATSDAPTTVAAEGERARLVSLVVLREFLAKHRDVVERVVERNRADAERMAEAYTLTTALEGGAGSSQGGSFADDDDEGGTMAPFVGFHHDVVRRLLETEAIVAPSWGETKTNGTVRVQRSYMMDAETSVLLVSDDGAKCVGTKDATWITSVVVRQLVARAALALQLAFPILCHTSLLKRCSTIQADTPTGAGDSLGLANASINATTLVLRLPHASVHHDVLLQMFHHGVFAAVVEYDYYHHSGSGTNDSDRFRGRDCELLRDGALRRVLVADPRGAALAGLLREAENVSSFAVHVGSDGAPEEALAAAQHVLRPWTVLSNQPNNGIDT